MNVWEFFMDIELSERGFEADTEEELRYIQEQQGEYEYER